MIWKKDKTKYKIVSPPDFDSLFSKEARIADLKTQKAEEDYERRDSRLIQILKNIAATNTTTENLEGIWIGDDWWADHTRHIEINYSYCSSGFISALQDTLTGEFSNYRIQMCVYRDISEGESYIGSLLLYSDRRLIEKPLYDLLKAN